MSHVGTNSTLTMTQRGMVVLEEPDMLKKRSTPPLLMSVWSFATVLGISKDQMRSSSLNKNYMEEQTKPRIIGIWNDILEIYRHGCFF